MNKNILIIGIIFLFFVSSFTSIVFGHNIETKKIDIELDKMLDNLRFVCTTPGGFSEEKYEYYSKMLLEQYSSENSNDVLSTENIIDKSEIHKISTLTLLSQDLMNSAWPMKCHDIRHTSQSPYSTGDNPGTEKWRFESSNWIEEGIVIDNNGFIYFGDFSRYIFALNPDGTEKWRFKTNGWIWAAPAIAADGTIYYGSWDGGLYAINPDGTRKWRFGSGDSIASSPVIDEDGTIYFGIMGPGDNGRIFAVNPDGTEKWHYDTGYWIVSDPCIGDDGTVYIGSGDTYLYAMNPDGTLKWRFKTGDIIQGPASIASDGIIYIGSFDDYTYAINLDGTKKWEYSVGPGTETNPSIANDGTIYVGSDKLYAINPDGTTKWSFNPGYERFIISSPAISADGTIYFGTNIGEAAGGEIIAVNPDGTEKWRKQIANKWVDSSPSIGEDGTVYIGSAYDMGKGYLHAFGPQETNTAPAPPIIEGPHNGITGESYDFRLASTDPENNPVKFYVDWGDGKSEWSEMAASGETIKCSHTWIFDNTYNIRVKAKDTFGLESDWSYLEVTMPRNKALQNTLLIKIFDHFPFLSRLLNFYPLIFSHAST